MYIYMYKYTDTSMYIHIYVYILFIYKKIYVLINGAIDTFVMQAGAWSQKGLRTKH